MKNIIIFFLFFGLSQITLSQEKKLNIIAIGAHPDDCDFKFGGTAALFAKMGHNVKFLSLTNGDVLSGVYRLTDLNYNGKILTEVRYEDYYKIQTPLLKPSTHRPVYWRKDGAIYFEGIPSDGLVSGHYIRKPKRPNWTYNNSTLLYDNSAVDHQDFELHASEEVDLTIKILALAGVTMKDPALYQTAITEENRNIQQEKS